MFKTLFRNLFLLLITVGFFACSPAKEEKQEEITSKVDQLEWSKNSSIYEINVRQYSEEGTFEAVRKDLPRIKSMGIRILWFMPIHPVGEINRKGGLGSHYSVQDYKEVNPDYGTKEDFRKLVDEAHEMGFKVIIDWVANHTAWDNPWTQNKDWFALTEEGDFMPPTGTDWSDVIQLNYENEEMRAGMIDALEFWVRDLDIDGYRCDVAGMVPTDFWVDAKAALDEIKPVFMLAEDGNPELVIEAFQMNYGWEYAHIIREVAKGERPISSVDSLFAEDEKRFPSSAYRMYFTSNHDENSWNGTDPEMYGANFENFAVLSATIGGMPLIYNGQESGLDKQLEFFEKDPIEWKDYKYQDFYTTLVGLKRDEQALWNGDFGGSLEMIDMPEGFYAYKRVKEESEVVVIMNFGNESGKVKLADLGVNENYTTYNSTKLMITSEEISFSPNRWAIFVK